MAKMKRPHFITTGQRQLQTNTQFRAVRQSKGESSDSAPDVEIRLDARRATFFGGAGPKNDSGPPMTVPTTFQLVSNGASTAMA
jgi:hypothetical protein